MGELAYVGLGANLGKRRVAIRAAMTALDRLRGVRVLRCSSLRWTDPEGGADQPRYLNGVAELACALSPNELLDGMLEIETALGRVRTVPKGPRTIDLDLLLFGGRRIRSRRLIVPHPLLTKRGFVLEPLAELCPRRIIPGTRRSVLAHLKQLPERKTA